MFILQPPITLPPPFPTQGQPPAQGESPPPATNTPPPVPEQAPPNMDNFYTELARGIPGATPPVTPPGTGGPQTAPTGDSYSGYPSTIVMGLTQLAAPIAMSANFRGHLHAISTSWRFVANGGNTTNSIVRIAGRLPGFARFASWTSGTVNWLGGLGTVAQKANWMARGAGNVVRGIGFFGRAVPILGALFAIGDNAYNWYEAGSLTRAPHESEAAFQARRGTARTDAAINTGCTAAGAIIGGIIGSVIPCAGTIFGAMIGAGIGNMIGRTFQSDGWGRAALNFVFGSRGNRYAPLPAPPTPAAPAGLQHPH